ncbi:MAG: glucosaminidase domain-containing protein [Bacteroidales bacterium]|jgi:LysM repeat protein|nr:glucosaminidase domain-containing protein [Bacteroidales bacterium]
MTRLFVLFWLAVVSVVGGYAQNNDTFTVRESYILQYKSIAQEEMKLYGIPASIKLAQALLESDAGKSELSRRSNNHFGIKCHKEWTGSSVLKDDDARNECFRKYQRIEESYRDHSLFLTSRPRYGELFKISVTDYTAWAYGLKKAGYATNPVYAEKLIKVIEDHQLFRYDSFEKPVVVNVEHDFVITDTVIRDEHPSHTEDYGTGPSDRKIFTCNGKKYIVYRKGDTPSSVALDFDLYTWQIYEFNDLEKETPIKAGQVIYVEKKKRKGDVDFHIVKPGESYHDIAQQHGMRLNILLNKNGLNGGTAPKSGDTLWLRKNKPGTFSFLNLINL